MSEQQSTAGQPSSTNDGAAGAAGAASGPTPQMIGIRFVKTYYQVLSTTPDQIFKFYKPLSVLSHGEGSTPTGAVKFEDYDLKDRWGEAQRFDFDNGAIDAQPSADGSILLVVTGHVLVKTDDGSEERKGFVHTFFLALVSLPNKQKTYYVHNDILRFLKTDVPSVSTAATDTDTTAPTPTPTPTPSTDTPEPPAEEEKPVVEEPAVVEPEEPPAKEEKKEEAPEVAEEKAEAPEEKTESPVEEKTESPAEEKPKGGKDQPAKETIAEPKKKEGKGKRQRGRGKSPGQQNAAKQQPASKPTPGSWASLVASGSGPTTTTPAPPASTTPTKPPMPEKSEAPPKPTNSQKKEDKADAPNTKESGKGSKDKPKRDPDNTLVIKNLPEGTKEPELLAIFEPFAVQTNAKIVSSTISSHRGLAFVDYDSVAPVMAAVEQHGKEPIQLNGKVLEVDQKTAEQRARKARGGGYRSGSPNQQQNNNRGRQNKRNNGGRGGKGNRGSGGGNNSGGNNNNSGAGGGR